MDSCSFERGEFLHRFQPSSRQYFREGHTRDSGGTGAADRLESILRKWALLAGQPLGHAIPALQKAGVDSTSQRVVCFSEAPLENVKHILGQIDGRQCALSSYGVAIPKRVGRSLGVNPVWYLDKTPGRAWVLAPAMDALVTDAIKSGTFAGTHVAKISPFVEQMGTWPNNRKEFWWEREWRYVGDMRLPDRIVVLCPDADHGRFKKVLQDLESAKFERLEAKPGSGDIPPAELYEESLASPPYFLGSRVISPEWSLEEMLGVLGGWSLKDLRV